MNELRIYKVKNSAMLDAHPPRLVLADSQGAVRRHLQKPFVITVADAIEAVELTQKHGVVVERAGE